MFKEYKQCLNVSNTHTTVMTHCSLFSPFGRLEPEFHVKSCSRPNATPNMVASVTNVSDLSFIEVPRWMWWRIQELHDVHGVILFILSSFTHAAVAWVGNNSWPKSWLPCPAVPAVKSRLIHVAAAAAVAGLTSIHTTCSIWIWIKTPTQQFAARSL